MTERKKDLIRSIMYLNNSINSQHEFIENVIHTITQVIPEAEQISLADVAEDVLNEIIPIYDQYFTEEQLVELQTFFSTEIGKHYFRSMEDISIESIKIGEKVGNIVSNRIKEYKETLKEE